MTAARSIAGRYLLCDELASGGMATVHLGQLVGAVGFSRAVAIKRLHPQYAKEPEFVSMFTDEARIAARIRHPNVVATLDTVAEGGELFLVMELVEGESVSRLLRTAKDAKRSVPPEIASAILVGTLHGLHAAHEATNEAGEPLGVVHRDVSPQNILVGTDGLPRVLDFGVAKALGRLQTTSDGQIKGKTAYMAPEQLRGRPVDRRTDVYAAAVVLWEMLSGERLFVGDSPGETMARVLEQPVTPPSERSIAVSPALDAIVLRGLSRNPETRFSSAEAMADALEAAQPIAKPRVVGQWVTELAGEGLSRRTELKTRLDTIGISSVSVATPVPIPMHVREPRRRRLWPWLLAALASASLVVAFVLTSRTPTSGSPVPRELASASVTTAAASSTTIAASNTSDASIEIFSTTASATAPPKPKPTFLAKPPPPKKPDCTPPYTIDAEGVHVPKKECR